MAATSKIGKVSEALANWLNAGARAWNTPTSQISTAAATYDPVQTLEDLDDALVVEVLGLDDEPDELYARGCEYTRRTVLIGIRKRYGSGGAISFEWTDALILISEQIKEALTDAALTISVSGSAFRMHSAGHSPLYDPDVLRDQRTFFSVIETVWEETRARD